MRGKVRASGSGPASVLQPVGHVHVPWSTRLQPVSSTCIHLLYVHAPAAGELLVERLHAAAPEVFGQEGAAVEHASVEDDDGGPACSSIAGTVVGRPAVA